MINVIKVFILVLISSSVSSETIAIIGTGRVASALGPEFAKQGHLVIYGSRDPSSTDTQDLLEITPNNPQIDTQRGAAEKANVIVLAVPGRVAPEIVTDLGDLDGKIIIDPTNRSEDGDDGYRIHTIETSNSEVIQDLLPNSYIVKAFNTLNYRTMIDPSSSGGPVTIPIVGNHKPSKDFVSTLITGMELEPIDLGPVRFAHVLEGMLNLYVNGRMLGTPFNFHLRVDE